MGHRSIVSGIIIIKNVTAYNNAISELTDNDNYPWVRSEMFHLGATQHPLYYENPIATFAATYKNLDGGTE